MGEFARIPIRNSFYLSHFLFIDSILRVEMLKVIVQGKLSLGLNCLKDHSTGKGDFSVEVEPDFLAAPKHLDLYAKV